LYFRLEAGSEHVRLEDPQEKKAALEISSRKCEIFFFSLKTIKWAGRWGRLYENCPEQHYAKNSYTATKNRQENQRFIRLDRPLWHHRRSRDQ